MRCRIVPSPWMLDSTTRPARRKTCGSRPIPTPAGVPVTMTSPGNRVVTEDKYSINTGTGKIRSSVLLSCTRSPSMSHQRRSESELGTSSGVTTQGPSGRNPGSSSPG